LVKLSSIESRGGILWSWATAQLRKFLETFSHVRVGSNFFEISIPISFGNSVLDSRSNLAKNVAWFTRVIVLENWANGIFDELRFVIDLLQHLANRF